MCDCKHKMRDELTRMNPGAEEVAGQYEILTGRSYSNWDIQMTGMKKPKVVKLLHSYCPHCGHPYEEETK